jgi:hypothetical protein
MNEYLMIFLTGFGSVFSLGLNSRNINNGDYGWAAGTSFFIGTSQAFLWANIATATNTFVGAFVYSCSGALAVTASMWTHKRFINKKK